MAQVATVRASQRRLSDHVVASWSGNPPATLPGGATPAKGDVQRALDRLYKLPADVTRMDIVNMVPGLTISAFGNEGVKSLSDILRSILPHVQHSNQDRGMIMCWDVPLKLDAKPVKAPIIRQD